MTKTTVHIKFWFDNADFTHEVDDNNEAQVGNLLERWLDAGVERVRVTYPNGHSYERLNPSAPPKHRWAVVPEADVTEYEIYRKVQREFRMQDALAHLYDQLDLEPTDDIEQTEWFKEQQCDLNTICEALVEEYEHHYDCNNAENDTWDAIVSRYIE